MITVMSMNLRFGLADDGENRWALRQHLLPAFFAAHPADVIGFQEVNDFQATVLRQLLPNHQYIGVRPDAPERWQHNLIFYPAHWICESSGHYYLSDTPDTPSKLEGSQWPRQFVAGCFHTGRQRLLVANTHFDFNADVQVAAARIALNLLARFPKNLPRVLTGDFNAVPGSLCHTLLTSGAEGFQDAFDGAHVPTHHNFTGQSDGGQIDWILYSGKGMTTVACGAVTTSFRGRYPSDHFPVWARFRLISNK